MITYIIIGLILLLFALGGYYVISKKPVPVVVTEIKQCKPDAEYLDRTSNKCVVYSNSTLEEYKNAIQNKCKTQVVLDPYSDKYYYLNTSKDTVCSGVDMCKTYRCDGNGNCTGTDIVCPEGYGCRNGECVFGSCPAGKYKNSSGVCTEYSNNTKEQATGYENNQCVANISWSETEDKVTPNYKSAGTPCVNKCFTSSECNETGNCVGIERKTCNLGYECRSSDDECIFSGSCPNGYWNDVQNKICKPYDKAQKIYDDNKNNGCISGFTWSTNSDNITINYNNTIQGPCGEGYRCNNGGCSFVGPCADGKINDIITKQCRLCGPNQVADPTKTICIDFNPNDETSNINNILLNEKCPINRYFIASVPNTDRVYQCKSRTLTTPSPSACKNYSYNRMSNDYITLTSAPNFECDTNPCTTSRCDNGNCITTAPSDPALQYVFDNTCIKCPGGTLIDYQNDRVFVANYDKLNDSAQPDCLNCKDVDIIFDKTDPRYRPYKYCDDLFRKSLTL